MAGFDVEQMMIHPTTRVIEAVAFEPGRREWRVIDPRLKADFDLISKLDDGDFRVMSRDLDNSRWIRRVRGAASSGTLFSVGPNHQAGGFSLQRPPGIR